jgi:hypothetical protein
MVLPCFDEEDDGVSFNIPPRTPQTQSNYPSNLTPPHLLTHLHLLARSLVRSFARSQVPPFCRSDVNCPFNHNNPLFAQNALAQMFGNVGFPYFDKNRKTYQGIAVVWTIIGFMCTIFGCLGVINNANTFQWAYWSWGGSYESFLPPTDQNYT